MEPKIVSSPTVIATAVAEPDITLVPIKARFLYSSGLRLALIAELANFSTGSLSPVRDAWLINKSFAVIMRISAGTMSPAAR